MGQRVHLEGMDERLKKRMEQYVCAICGARKVVPMLARDCETKHLEDESV